MGREVTPAPPFPGIAMSIDWTSFTPLPALAGGLLIGGGAALLLLATGRIAGISGILASVPQSGRWRAAFLTGLIAPAAILTLAGRAEGFAPVLSLADWPRLAAAGLLVGIGTRLANGCTSGHGICGLARLSPRSLVAVPLFMLSAMAVVAVMP